MRHCLYILLIGLVPSLCQGQVLSKTGRFAVDFDRGCVPFELNITELDTFGNITRAYFYGDGSPETTSTNYTYNFPGTFEIVQLVGTNVTPKTDTLVVYAIEPTGTNFTIEKCNLNGVTITSQEQVYDSLRVYFTPTDSASLAFGESASFTYPSTATQTFQTRGLYANGKVNCTLFSHDVNPLVTLTTPQIVNSQVRETCRDFFALSLDLDGVDSLINYEVELEQSGSSVVFQGTINDDPLVIPGVNFDRNLNQYCVKVNAVDVCTGDRLEGETDCEPITEFSVSPFGNLYSTYTAEGVLINMDSVSSGSLLVNRRLIGDGDFQLRATVQNTYADPISTLSRQYFYRIDYLDSCNEVLYSVETNPPLIVSDRLEENSYSITVTDPVNLLEEPSIAFYDIGNETVTSELITSNNFTLRLNPTNGTRQFLNARVEYQNVSLLSNQLVYKYIPIIYVPSAFTPNGDQLNDTLELFGLPTETATTKIYNRWGQLIYTSDEPSPGWDGFINGDLAPEGSYLYEVIFEDSDGERVIQKGTFALLKK